MPPILKHAIRLHPKKRHQKRNQKKRGRQLKKEREQWLIEQAEKEMNLPLFVKKIDAQLDVSLARLSQEIPQAPQWGVRIVKERMYSGIVTKAI
jgi:transposase